MQPATSDKTFHLKWNNHLQNLSQLFTTIYSSSALADVTLSCRDGSIRAHKLVLSACSPYFEQIFKDNPCKHPVIILKGIPYAEINLLVEFMYKGSVDVQELDLQSLMHTASELEIRGLAYELRKDASNLLNVNLNEYPNFSSTPNTSREIACQPVVETVPRPAESPYDATPRSINPYQTNLERLRQIHMYQQAMCRPAEGSTIKRKRKNEDSMPANTTTAVENILAAAAKELAEKKAPISKQKISTCIQTDETEDVGVKEEVEEDEESEAPLHGRDTRFKGKKRVSVGLDDHYPSSVSKVKPVKRSVKFSIKSPSTAELANPEDAVSKLVITAVTGNANTSNLTSGHGTLKCVNLDNLRNSHIVNTLDIDDNDNDNEDSSGHESSDDNTFDESKFVQTTYPTENEEYDSSDCGKVESTNKTLEKIFKCDLCDLSYSRNSHMIRHRRTHSGERPFKCNTCPFSFNRSSHLARHRRTHTGERPYRCEACGRCFARGDKLKLHMRICEKDEYVLPSHNTVIEQDVSKILKKDLTMMSGMVSIGHSERHQLMFTSSGDVMLPPRDSSNHVNESDVSRTDDFNSTNASSAATPSTSDTSLLSQQYYSLDSSGYPTKRGRGRPRKKPLPPISMPVIKKKRGRPPKVIKLDPSDNSRGLQNYTASDLPYGDFSYLTDIISTHFNQPGQQAYPNMVQLNAAREASKLPPNISSNFAHKVDIGGTTLTGKHTIDTIRKIVLQEKTPESAQSDILTIKKVRVETNNENKSSSVLPIVIPEITVPSEAATAVDSHCDDPTSDEEKSPENCVTETPAEIVDDLQTCIEEVDSDDKNESPDAENVMMVGDCQIVNIKGTLESSSEVAEGNSDVPNTTAISECNSQPVEPNVE